MKRFAALCRNLQALVLAAFAGSAGTQAQVPPDPDTAAWEAARTAGTAEACQRYLEEFPVGRYAEEAFRCIVEETLPAAGPPETATRRGETGAGCDEVGGGAACVVIPELPAPAAGPVRPAPAPPAPAPDPAPVAPAQVPGAPDADSEPVAPEQIAPAPAADPAPVAPDQVPSPPAAELY